MARIGASVDPGVVALVGGLREELAACTPPLTFTEACSLLRQQVDRLVARAA